MCLIYTIYTASGVSDSKHLRLFQILFILTMNKSSSMEKQQIILRLPPEILGKILLSSLQTRTMILSSVCKNLNHFIFNHDILWSKLNLNSLKNISNSTIPKIFNCNIPNDTKYFIR